MTATDIPPRVTRLFIAVFGLLATLTGGLVTVATICLQHHPG